MALDISGAVKKVIDKFASDVCDEYAYNAAELAKDNAPWQDRSGNARRMLKGFTIKTQNTVGFGVAHRVEYGEYLEMANDGKYAILYPTIEALRVKFFADAAAYFGGKK